MAPVSARAQAPGPLVRPRGAIGLLGLTVALLGGCGSVEDPLADRVDGRTYVSASVEGHDLVAGSTITLTFEGEDLAARAGCNTMRGGWTDGDGEEVRWTSPPASTLMACEPALMDQDTWLAGLLTDGMDVVDGDADLTLTSGDVTIALDESAATSGG